MDLCYRVADQLCEGSRTQRAMPVVGYPRPGVLLRNAVYMLIVPGHGFRLSVPPY